MHGEVTGRTYRGFPYKQNKTGLDNKMREGPRKMSTVLPNEIRRENLRRVVRELGGHAAVAKRLKLAGSSWVSQLIQGIRPFTEKTARKFERGLGLKQGYLDQVRSPDELDSVPGSVNRDVPGISEALAVIDSLLSTRKQTLTNERYGRVVEIVFSQGVKHGTIDAELAAKILDLID